MIDNFFRTDDGTCLRNQLSPAPGGTTARRACPRVSPSSGRRAWRLVPCRPDRDEAYLAALAGDEDPGDPDEYEDPDCAPPPGLDDTGLAALIAEAREVTEDQARAADVAARLGQTAAMGAVAAAIGRRGPGMPGSARSFPGEYASRAAGFATGKPLDTAPGCAALGCSPAMRPATRTGTRAPPTTSCGRDLRLGPGRGARQRPQARGGRGVHPPPPGPGLRARRARLRCPRCGMSSPPRSWPRLWASPGVLPRTRWGWRTTLQVKLPGTAAAFRAGILNQDKAEIIAAATHVLDPGEARAAEALVLGRAGSLTPAGLRSAIARAVMEVAPEKAKKRREEAARAARVERWAEDSGNAALAGRELPPAEVLAADQRVTAWAKELKRAGLDGDMDQLRARAYLDILLGIDSRPAGRGTHGQSADGAPPAPAGPLAGLIPPGFAGRVTLTTPLATLTRLAAGPASWPGSAPSTPAWPGTWPPPRPATPAPPGA